MSLQFPSRSGYFSALAKRRVCWAILGVLVGCGERERLTFPEEQPGNGSGPVTNITRPGSGDTLVSGDEQFVVTGFSADPDGVDAVFFEVEGAGVTYAPLNGQGSDTVHFSIQLPTLGRAGDTIFVQISAVDLVGDAGVSSIRRIRVQ